MVAFTPLLLGFVLLLLGDQYRLQVEGRLFLLLRLTLLLGFPAGLSGMGSLLQILFQGQAFGLELGLAMG